MWPWNAATGHGKQKRWRNADSRKMEPGAPATREAVGPVTLSIKEAAGAFGIGRSTIYKLINDRQLQTIKIGNRTLVTMASIRRLAGIK